MFWFIPIFLFCFCFCVFVCLVLFCFLRYRLCIEQEEWRICPDRYPCEQPWTWWKQHCLSDIRVHKSRPRRPICWTTCPDDVWKISKIPALGKGRGSHCSWRCHWRQDIHLAISQEGEHTGKYYEHAGDIASYTSESNILLLSLEFSIKHL